MYKKYYSKKVGTEFQNSIVNTADGWREDWATLMKTN